MTDTELVPRDVELSTLPLGVVRAGTLGMSRIEEHAAWPLMARLAMRLEAGIPKKGRQNKAKLDAVSATLILRSYMERRKVQNEPL